MNDTELIEAFRKEVLKESLQSYKAILETTPPDQATDDYWRALLDFYAELPASSKRLLLGVMRQVMVDTLSSVFAVLDGVFMLSGQEEDFVLSHQGERLNGNLQEILLSQEEDEE